MLTLTTSISNYMWGIICFILGTGFLIMGVQAIVKQPMSKFKSIIRLIAIVSMTVASYSVAIANILIDRGYEQLSNYFALLTGLSILILLITGGVAKYYSNGRN